MMRKALFPMLQVLDPQCAEPEQSSPRKMNLYPVMSFIDQSQERTCIRHRFTASLRLKPVMKNVLAACIKGSFFSVINPENKHICLFSSNRIQYFTSW